MTIVFALNKRIQLGYGSISTYIRPVELLPKVIVLQVSKGTMGQFILDGGSTVWLEIDDQFEFSGPITK